MLNDQISNLHLSEIITPKFSLSSKDIGEYNLISISEGSIAYNNKNHILHNIHLSINSKDRIAITGDNASGKSTLIKAIMNEVDIVKLGQWHIPNLTDIGYLDQHYRTLVPSNTALETIQDLVSTWSHAEIRHHLNDFLFRKNEEVNTPIINLSGGEKVRLTLAQIAAKTPKLLILDEITNNIDLETKEHVVQVLKNYPGAMIIISHNEMFLEEIGIHTRYRIHNGEIKLF
jgi:ATPase subunit of ABC transporter with duplicated ATPase domains